MATTKLTLSLDADLVKRAKRLAKQKHTSVSGLFGHYIEAMMPRGKRGMPIGPLTRQATGLVHAPHNKSYRELIEEALAEKSGLAP